VTGIGLYPDGMVEHDTMVGEMLKKLDDMGIADNTIVIYGTDNGAETVTWPDGGTTPYHSEKARPGRAASACPASCAGRGDQAGHHSSTTSCPRKTGCPRCSPRRANQTSSPS